MTPSQRIFFNTIVTYGRSVLAMGLGLFSSRWVLQALGPQDFGLYSVVGSIIIFITFLNGVTAGSVARFLAFSIGKDDSEETCRWFNTALFLHTLIPLVILLIGWPLGEWAVRHFLNIPVERFQTCLWVFRLSLIAAFISMISTPYIGMHTAKQKLAELAIWNLLASFGTFTLAYGLTRYRGDALLFYACGVIGIHGIMQLIQVIRAKRLFPECHLHFAFWWDSKRIVEIMSFAGWVMFGFTAVVLRGQGTAILLNRFFNPLSFPFVNAAYGIGNSVAGQVNTLSSAMLGAFTPEITASEGRGDRLRMLLYALRASKYGTYLLLLFAIPVFIEMDYLLSLWLKTPPELAATFCRMMLIYTVIDTITIGAMLAVNAKGKVRGYQVTLGICVYLTLPLAWVFLRYGGAATSVMLAFLLTMTGHSIGRLIWARHLVGMSIGTWAKQVLLPLSCVMVASGGVGCICHMWNTASPFLRLISVTVSTWMVTYLVGWLFVVDAREKVFSKTFLLKAHNFIFQGGH